MPASKAAFVYICSSPKHPVTLTWVFKPGRMLCPAGCGEKVVQVVNGLLCDSRRGGCGAVIRFGVVDQPCQLCGRKLRAPAETSERAA
jgi:hypothetical protein